MKNVTGQSHPFGCCSNNKLRHTLSLRQSLVVADTGNVIITIGDVGCCPIQIPRQGLLLCTTVSVTDCIMVHVVVVVTLSQTQPRFALAAYPLQLDKINHVMFLLLDISIVISIMT